MTGLRPIVVVAEQEVLALSPASPPPAGAAAVHALARRPPTLDGAVLALVDDGFNSPGLPEAILSRLRARFHLAEVIWAHKDSVSVPPREEDWAAITTRATAGIALYGG